MGNNLEKENSINTPISSEASNDAIFDVQEKTGGDILKITKLGGFTQIILATLEKIKDPASKIKELQEARANICKVNPEDCENDDLYEMSANK
nr:hypothetical protein [Candidatus Gracilibacteria bacterium]